MVRPTDKFITRERLACLLPWLLLVAALALVAGEIENPWAALHLWRRWAEIGALSVVMTGILLTGGIDLSVGSIVALSSVTLGVLWHDVNWPIEAAAAAAVFVGLAAGALNATLIVCGIPPLVATLATKAFFAGLALAISGGQRVSGLPERFTSFAGGEVFGVPTQFLLMGIVFVVGYVIVHHSRFGRYLFAIGDNRLAATYSAVPVKRVEWSLYVASGLVAGLVAVAYTARDHAAIPDAGKNLELAAIACVVVGGTRVTGGVGGVGRTLLGVAIMSNLEIGLQMIGTRKFHLPFVAEPWQFTSNGRLIVIGALVIALAVWNERVAARRHLLA